MLEQNRDRFLYATFAYAILAFVVNLLLWKFASNTGYVC